VKGSRRVWSEARAVKHALASTSGPLQEPPDYHGDDDGNQDAKEHLRDTEEHSDRKNDESDDDYADDYWIHTLRLAFGVTGFFYDRCDPARDVLHLACALSGPCA
jgi:hypothetical protein